jgi:transcriptional regulator with XRE-family HTH domain
MNLGGKLRVLRVLEGSLRGLNKPLSKADVVRLVREELGESISHAYLSQLESGRRTHMTEKSRQLLARFFKVHPGFLVSDPEGYCTQLVVVPPPAERGVDEWLGSGAEKFSGSDPELAEALATLARHPRSRDLLVLLARLSLAPQAPEPQAVIQGLERERTRP